MKTKTRLSKELVVILVDQQAEFLSERTTGCMDMLKYDNQAQLQDMYIFFKKSETASKYIIKQMIPYIEKVGKEIVNDPEM